MTSIRSILIGSALLAVAPGLIATASADGADMSFFLTSNGPGQGGNLGGLAGADRH